MELMKDKTGKCGPFYSVASFPKLCVPLTEACAGDSQADQ